MSPKQIFDAALESYSIYGEFGCYTFENSILFTSNNLDDEQESLPNTERNRQLVDEAYNCYCNRKYGKRK